MTFRLLAPMLQRDLKLLDMSNKQLDLHNFLVT